MAERLGYGLQIRPQRFNSASHLQSAQETPSRRGLLVFIVANVEMLPITNVARFQLVIGRDNAATGHLWSLPAGLMSHVPPYARRGLDFAFLGLNRTAGAC